MTTQCNPPLIYIAGPFTGPTAWDIAENVRKAERWGLEVAHAGGMPVIPHANTHLFHGQLTSDFWYAGTLQLLRVCQGIVLIPEWRDSKGARAEQEEARRWEIPSWDPTDSDTPLRQFVEQCSRRDVQRR